jgi:NDP-sugar pyrophosphorylase family protein
MILAAGLGTRLRPLSDLCAKPAMPVRGVPVIAHTLTWLAQSGVREVAINLHHLPETVRDAVRRHQPEGLEVRWSEESELLGTGGGVRAVAEFLRGSDPSVVVAGDMLVDLDLRAAVAAHRARRDRVSLLVRDDDPRAEAFGTLGFDEQGSLRRIGARFDLGAETRRGLFLGIRLFAARSFTDWPAAQSFEDLTEWLGPLVRAGARDIRVVPIPAQASLWEPVGTAEEYLAVNLTPPALGYRGRIPGKPAATVLSAEKSAEEMVIVGTGARIEAGASLERVVVWPGERVPDHVRARRGVYAGGRFVPIDGPGAEGKVERKA